MIARSLASSCLLVALTAEAAPPPIFGTFIEGTDLASWAAEFSPASTRTMNALRFQYYVMGMADSLAAQQVICLPNGIVATQLVAVVAKAVADRPKDWSLGATELVGTILIDEYPCLPGDQKN